LAEHGADRGREGGQQGGHTNVGRRTDRWQQGLQHRRRDRPTERGCSRCEPAGDARTDFSVGTAVCEAAPKPPKPDSPYEGFARRTRQCLQDCDSMKQRGNSCGNPEGPVLPFYVPGVPYTKANDCHNACFLMCSPIVRLDHNPFVPPYWKF